jgi:hypothetical protein
MPGVRFRISCYPAPEIRNASTKRELTMMRGGMPAGHQHPQHVNAALARLA